MSEINNIDDLFKSKLQGRESGAYSEAAWKGADALLNRHFRLVLIKKILFFSVPSIIVLSAIAWFTTYNDVASINPSFADDSMTTEQMTVTNEDQVKLESKTSVSIASTDESGFPLQTKTTDLELTSSEVAEHIVSDKPTAHKNQALEANNKLLTQENTIEEYSKRNSTSSPKSYSAKVEAKNSAYTSIASSIKDQMEEMPTFILGAISTGNNTSIIAQKSKPSYEGLMEQLRRFELGITGGGLIANGFQNTSATRENPTIGWFGGFTAKYHINARLYAQTGIILNGRSALASKRTEAIALVGFIYSTSKNLVYADIPLRIGYNFGARHSIGFGMTFSPLVGYSPFTESTNIIEDPNEENPQVTRNGFMAREGFANFDVAGSLNYSFQMTQRLDFTADVRFGLFDITDNQYFGTSVIDDRNHQLRMGLSYRLINR